MRKIKTFLDNIRDNIAAIMFLAVFLVVYVLVFGLETLGFLDRYIQVPNDYVSEETSKHFLKLEIKKIEYEQRQRSSRTTTRHS